MPLKKSSSKAAFKENVKAEVKAGKPVKQAVVDRQFGEPKSLSEFGTSFRPSARTVPAIRQRTGYDVSSGQVMFRGAKSLVLGGLAN